MPALVALLLLLLTAAPAAAVTAEKPWPPADGPGHLYVHYGEEHIDDIDGPRVLPQIVADVSRYRPDLVTMSGDKVSDGTTELLESWYDAVRPFDDAGVPWMAGVGNHDGKQATPEAVTEEAGGVTPLRDIGFYREVFADRPYPMGDAPPYPGLGPAERPADDPHGAATHYYVDAGPVRWVFLDNSCYGIVNCDPLQVPPDGRGRTQYEYLADAAGEAGERGMRVFVVMHMPSRDPRDQQNAYYTSLNHVMGKGISPDNQRFEVEAERLGVDAVFLAHIKGQFQYTGLGGIPYFIDGGAGGELYSSGPLGVDHGYWYGWRLIHVDGDGAITTDAVPVIAPGSLTVEGPDRLPAGGDPVTFAASAAQPAAQSERAVVERLELRDPDPAPRAAAGGVPGWIVWLAPLGLVAALALAAPAAATVPRRRLRRVVAVAVAGLAGAAGLAGGASAQRSAPDATPKENLPNPARIWTSARPEVLAPVASDSDDPRRDPATQTADGTFEPRCPGRAKLRITSGHEQTAHRVTVASADGPIIRSIRRRARVARRGRARKVATVNLAQPAVASVVVRRKGKRRLTALRRTCLKAGPTTVRLTPRRSAERGRYRVVVKVRSDRPTVKRRFRLRVR